MSPNLGRVITPSPFEIFVFDLQSSKYYSLLCPLNIFVFILTSFTLLNSILVCREVLSTQVLK